MPVAILLLLLYYHPLQTALLNIWKDHFNGWVESRLMWGRQNNRAGIAHEGENFGQLCMMLSHHPIFLFFEAKESCLLFHLRLRKQSSWCGTKENSYVSFTLKEHIVGWENWMQLSAVSKTNTAKLSHAPTLPSFRVPSFTFFHSTVWCIAVFMFESLYCNDKMTAGNIIMSPKKNIISSSLYSNRYQNKSSQNFGEYYIIIILI